MTLNFQSGIAADTLLFGSVHRAKWSATPITVGTTTTLGSAAINNSFSAGYSRTEFDDVTITGFGPASPVYTGNSANTFGVKLQVNF
jgi:hypothetical protein